MKSMHKKIFSNWEIVGILKAELPGHFHRTDTGNATTILTDGHVLWQQGLTHHVLGAKVA
jgi:hypothetical protein